jgi:hypothetical protein
MTLTYIRTRNRLYIPCIRLRIYCRIYMCSCIRGQLLFVEFCGKWYRCEPAILYERRLVLTIRFVCKKHTHRRRVRKASVIRDSCTTHEPAPSHTNCDHAPCQARSFCAGSTSQRSTPTVSPTPTTTPNLGYKPKCSDSTQVEFAPASPCRRGVSARTGNEYIMPATG